MLNILVIHGRIVRDPELRKTNAGKSVATFTVAVDRDVKDRDGKREADFVDCVAWDKLAEFVHSYLQKGKECIVQGRLQSRKWVDKNGNNRLSWELIASKAEFAGSSREIAASPAAPRNDYPIMADDDGDCPF